VVLWPGDIPTDAIVPNIAGVMIGWSFKDLQ
jgi:hypothetical protein